MTFMPILPTFFDARGGKILFLGRVITDLKAAEAQRAIMREALDCRVPSYAFDVWEEVHDQIVRSRGAALAFRKLRAD